MKHQHLYRMAMIGKGQCSCDAIATHPHDNFKKSYNDNIASNHWIAEYHDYTTVTHTLICCVGIDRHLFCLYVMSKYCNEESPFLKKVSIQLVS